MWIRIWNTRRQTWAGICAADEKYPTVPLSGIVRIHLRLKYKDKHICIYRWLWKRAKLVCDYFRITQAGCSTILRLTEFLNKLELVGMDVQTCWKTNRHRIWAYSVAYPRRWLLSSEENTRGSEGVGLLRLDRSI